MVGRLGTAPASSAAKVVRHAHGQVATHPSRRASLLVVLDEMQTRARCANEAFKEVAQMDGLAKLGGSRGSGVRPHARQACMDAVHGPRMRTQQLRFGRRLQIKCFDK